MIDHLNWYWVWWSMTAPLAGGLAVAWPLWLRNQPIFGNLVGTAVTFGWGIAMILREHIEVDRIVQQCFADGYVCFPTPSAFTRFAIYAFIALAETVIVFSISLTVENRVRRRGYAPEWR
jgi:hypothetical protein